ncbi:hypothetical protein ACWELV_46860 [Streptomyces mirabilis]
MTKEPASDLFAARFDDAGFSVLTFDHRRFGESGGASRQIVLLDEQVADRHAAIECATGLPQPAPLRPGRPFGEERLPRTRDPRRRTPRGACERPTRGRRAAARSRTNNCSPCSESSSAAVHHRPIP